MGRDLAIAVAAASRATVEGTFYRHTSTNVRPLSGSASGGRWAVPGVMHVLYLGRPEPSVVVEAYRHLVDPYVDDGMTGDMVQARRFVTCEVQVTNVLDLRTVEAQAAVGLDEDALASDVGDYDLCQMVARVAHQLELHGIIAPAATGLGETLALFERHLPESELPRLIDSTTWPALPADPRRLRDVSDEDTA